MLQEEIKNIREEKSHLRKFGLSVGAVLTLIGVALFLSGKSSFLYFGAAGLSLILLGLVLPQLLKPLNKIWMTLAIILGWFMSRLILTILFYLILTPTGFILKIMGKDFLKLRINKNVNSYWEKREKRFT